MVYEKKEVLPRETAYVQKASVYSRQNKPFKSHAAEELVKKAISAQNERFDTKMHGKEDMI